MSLEHPLQAVLLDVGGTLLREDPPRAAIYASAARARGLDVADDAMRALMLSTHHAMPRVLDGAYRYTDPWFEAFIARIFVGELGLAPARLDDLTAELFERFESAATFRLYPGCVELLDACRARGLKLGVVSNWSERLSRVLAAVGIAGAFDAVLCSAREGYEKPEPEIFRRALARLGVASGAALHAGDHPRKDGYGARSAGIEAVLVDHAAPPADPGGARGFPRVGGLFELRDRILSRFP